MNRKRHSWKFLAIGTVWEIISEVPLPELIRQDITTIINQFDAVYSRFHHNSLVKQLAHLGLPQRFPESAAVIFAFYDELFELSSGLVTPLVGDTLESAGYDAEYSLKPQKKIVAPKNYKNVLKWSRLPEDTGTIVELKEPAALDIGAVGKGYLVDEIVTVLKKSGLKNFIVDGSGDLRVVGEWQERIGLENPLDTQQVIGIVPLKNGALCASAGNRRRWGDWHHIINPVTSRPTENVIATWVIADTTFLADGLSTALFFIHPNALKSKYNYEYVRVLADGRIEYSDYFAEGIFT